MSLRLVPKSVTLNDLEGRDGRYFALFQRIRVYLPGVLRKSSRSLSHLLMSSCLCYRRPLQTLHVMLYQDLSVWMKTWRVLWMAMRFCIGLGCLYFFVCSLDVLQDSFQLLSGQCCVYVIRKRQRHCRRFKIINQQNE